MESIERRATCLTRYPETRWGGLPQHRRRKLSEDHNQESHIHNWRAHHTDALNVPLTYLQLQLAQAARNGQSWPGAD
jgi:hypothetical protein